MNTKQKLPTDQQESAVISTTPAPGGPALPQPVPPPPPPDATDIAVEDDLPLSDCGPETALCW